MLDTAPEMKQINVIGYNSARFDTHLFLKHILPKDETTPRNFLIKAIIGNVKMLILKHVETEREFRFIDAMGFLSGGTLDQNAQAFNPGAGREKGYFPYEFLTVENYQTELQKSEPFTHDSFYSSLKQSNIKEDEYQVYLKEHASAASNRKSPKDKLLPESMTESPCGTEQSPTAWCSRLEYLLYYNERDTQIMLPIIDGLTDLFWENKIDMLHNLSLSSCSSQTKYALAYKDFNINADYSVPSGKIPYNLTMAKWLKKVDGYRKQDFKAKRDTKNSVSKNDFVWACREFSKGCHMCHCQFDEDNNIPTLDRIDNNIGHQKDNLLPLP
jgi:hypothetical protein